MSGFKDWLLARTTVLDHSGARHDFEFDEPLDEDSPSESSSRLGTVLTMCLVAALLAISAFVIYSNARTLSHWLGGSIPAGIAAAIAIRIAFDWICRRYPGARSDREERADRIVERRLAKGRCGTCAFQLPAAPAPQGPFVRCSECGACWHSPPVPVANPESAPNS